MPKESILLWGVWTCSCSTPWREHLRHPLSSCKSIYYRDSLPWELYIYSDSWHRSAFHLALRGCLWMLWILDCSQQNTISCSRVKQCIVFTCIHWLSNQVWGIECLSRVFSVNVIAAFCPEFLECKGAHARLSHFLWHNPLSQPSCTQLSISMHYRTSLPVKMEETEYIHVVKWLSSSV